MWCGAMGTCIKKKKTLAFSQEGDCAWTGATAIGFLLCASGGTPPPTEEVDRVQPPTLLPTVYVQCGALPGPNERNVIWGNANMQKGNIIFRKRVSVHGRGAGIVFFGCAERAVDNGAPVRHEIYVFKVFHPSQHSIEHFPLPHFMSE